MNITVVGGVNLDILGMPSGEFVPRDSNIGEIVFRAGGVGRNIAARLIEAGADVSFVTALGRDEKSDLLRVLCARDGIDLSCAVETDAPACAYLCVHDERGDMLAAVNDMRAAEALTPEALIAHLPRINRADACVIDANLSEETLAFLAERVAVPLIADPVSTAKAGRMRRILPSLAAIKPNLMEATTLTGKSEPLAAARALVRAGAQRAFISLGDRGVCFADTDESGVLPAIPIGRVPLTGAGDAMLAGIVIALTQGKSTMASAQSGIDAAHRYLSKVT